MHKRNFHSDDFMEFIFQIILMLIILFFSSLQITEIVSNKIYWQTANGQLRVPKD